MVLMTRGSITFFNSDFISTIVDTAHYSMRRKDFNLFDGGFLCLFMMFLDSQILWYIFSACKLGWTKFTFLKLVASTTTTTTTKSFKTISQQAKFLAKRIYKEQWKSFLRKKNNSKSETTKQIIEKRFLQPSDYFNKR